MDLFRKKTPEQLHEASEKTGLKKSLTAFDLAALGIGSVVGTGIFVATGTGAMKAGPGVTLSYLVAAITCGLCALTYSELASMFPVAGSTYSYSYVAFGELIAWIIGWDLMLEYLVSASAVASGWSGYFVGLLAQYDINIPAKLTGAPILDKIDPATNKVVEIISSGKIMDLPAILITLLVTWLLYVGIKESAKLNNVIVGVKILVILLFVFLGVTHIDLSNFHPFMPFGWKGVMAGAGSIFFAYIGFDAVSTAAEETKNPTRDVPLGLAICLGVVIILYIGVSVTLTGMVPFTKIDVSNALPSALSSIGITWGSSLVAIGATIGMISTLLVTIYGQIRIFMVMSRDGLLPAGFGKIHPKHQTPYICTWITGITVAILGGFLPLNMIIDLCNIGTLFAFVLVSVGVIVLRKTMPDAPRPFKVPGAPFTPILTLLMCFYVMAALPMVTWERFIVWLLVGFVIYFAYGQKHSTMNKKA
jgi:basic amino acid/polyamine antiporter, APA family